MADHREPALLAWSFDGRPVESVDGLTVAAALWVLGVRTLRRSSAARQPRGVYCCMGICFECLVRVDGREVRACTTPVRAGMVVESAG